jgi:hypothetical protein
MCLWLVLGVSSASADALKGSHIAGMLITTTGYAVANGSVKLVDADGVMLNVATTDGSGKFKLELDTLEDEDLENLSQSYLHFSNPKGKSTKVLISDRAVQEDGFISFPVVTLE